MKNQKMRVPLLVINSLSSVFFSTFYIIFLINVSYIDSQGPEENLFWLLIFGGLTAVFFLLSCVLNFLNVLYASKEGYKKVVYYYFWSILLMPFFLGVIVNLYINFRFTLFELSQNKTEKITN